MGFVFARGSRRYVTPEKAAELKRLLSPAIRAVGVTVNEEPETIAALLKNGVIDMVQLHGNDTACRSRSCVYSSSAFSCFGLFDGTEMNPADLKSGFQNGTLK